MSEPVKFYKLLPDDVSDGCCSQDSISSHSADDCNEQLQLSQTRQEGEILEYCNSTIFD